MLCGFGIKLRLVIFAHSVFVKITKNSQENSFAGASFLIKLQPGGSGKKDLAKVFFCEFFVVFKNIDIVEHLRTASSKVHKDF